MNNRGDLWAEERLPSFRERNHEGTVQPDDDRIYVMYHGTTSSAAENIIKNGFEQSPDGMLGEGVYVSKNKEKALRYPLEDEDKKYQVVLKLRVNVGKVIRIDYQQHPLRTSWHDHGFDTAWVPPFCGMVESNLEEDCVWDPERIKVVGVVHAAQAGVQKDLNGLVKKYAKFKDSRAAMQDDGVADCTVEIFGRGDEQRHGRALMASHTSNQYRGRRFYTMYHGTNYSAAVSIIKDGFRQSADGMLGKGVYVTRDEQKACRYPAFIKSEQVVLKLSVRVGKVKKIDAQHMHMAKTWHDHGYNSAWVPPNCGLPQVPNNLEEDCVWNPGRIKWLTNIFLDDQVDALQMVSAETLENAAHVAANALVEWPRDLLWWQEGRKIMINDPTAATNFHGRRARRGHRRGEMAYNFGYTMNYSGDLWAEETLPNFSEIILQSTAQPTDGKIYVMYHGTTFSAAVSIIKNGFEQSPDGMLGAGVYVSRDEVKARRYPLKNQEDQVVLKLRVNVGKVIKIDRQNHRLQKTWHDYGYDTAWVPPTCGMVKSNLEEDCVWDPERVKVVNVAHAAQAGVEQYLQLLIQQYAKCEDAEGHSTARAESERGERSPPQDQEAMAYNYGYDTNYRKDFWEEETLPKFEEIFLQSIDKPTDGKIYTMYHGTTSSAAVSIIKNGFCQSSDGMLGEGVYVSRDEDKALRYPLEDKEDQVVLRIKVNVGKVIKIDRQNHRLQKTWHDHGYDTAWVPESCGMVKSNLEEDCVWDPKRIKVVGVTHAAKAGVKKYLKRLVKQYEK
ncbi:PREDICTED: uncharacterized protein LOC108802274 [Nanorana parkeri]|uniref:uncharacterized protein LOC108802274 n=1 Tax=Nanorana parkeri TaxID=125878 RepID=UPI0008542F2A|nr:PREDICTED: uncharacterized protein LOC108802274 [Nanorana parkeri]